MKHLAPEFPRKRALTMADVHLPPNASDSAIVKAAWRYECIIVTANGKDFEREIRKFQRQMMITNCHDLSGLVVVPDGAMAQKRSLKKLEDRLRFGGKRLDWQAVRSGNFYVRATKSGSPGIRRFPRCIYCEKNESFK